MIIFTENIIKMEKCYISPVAGISVISSESFFAASGDNESFTIKPGEFDGKLDNGNHLFPDFF